MAGKSPGRVATYSRPIADTNFETILGLDPIRRLQQSAAMDAKKTQHVNRPAVLAIAAALGLLIVLGVGVRLSRTDYASAAWFTTLLLLVTDGLVAWHLLIGGGVKAIRRAALISVLATVALIANCSTQSGDGSRAIAADPTAYLSTLLIIVGPLLLVLAAPGLISIATLTRKRERWILGAAVLGAVVAPVTAYAGFVLSYAVFCTNAHPTAAQSAECVASSGSLAGMFGIIGPAMVLPPLLLLMRRPDMSGSVETPSSTAGI
jgi:hypothetical protein